MSTSKSAAAWWAANSTRARLTTVGAALLVLILTTLSVFVWTSPSSPINQAIESSNQKDQIVAERNKLLSQVVALKQKLAKSENTLAETESERAAVQQELWSLEGTLEAMQSNSGQQRYAKSASGKPPAGAAAASITAPSKAEILNPATPYFGMYTEQAPHNWATYDATSQKLGVRPSVVGYFGGWDEDFRPSAVSRAWERGTLPILTWESRPINSANDVVDEPLYTLPAIIGDRANGVPGTFDDYLHQYARDIVATGLPLGIRLNHEMNGVWYPWAETNGGGESINGNRPGDYVKMWQHVHDIFGAEGANDLVTWIWAPNIVNNLPATHQKDGFLDALYPGDAYVDWIGLSGYLRPPYKEGQAFTFDYTFGRSLNEIRSISDKPIFLAEVGASETGGFKAKWITTVFEELARPENSDIVGLAWFNLAITTYIEGERGTNDWRIDSRGDSLEAFRLGLNSPNGPFVLRAY